MQGAVQAVDIWKMSSIGYVMRTCGQPSGYTVDNYGANLWLYTSQYGYIKVN